MSVMTIQVRVHTAWWVMPYLRSLLFVAWLTGIEVDEERAKRIAMRGIHMSIAN